MNIAKINEEMIREPRGRIRDNKKELNQLSLKLKERNKELTCLYGISSFKEHSKFTLEGIFREIVDFIPQGCFHPEIIGARIFFEGYEFKTTNFQDIGCNLSQEIMIFNKRIGILEVCDTGKTQSFAGLFHMEKKKLINAIAKSIARIIERQWAEVEIRRCREKIEKLKKQN